MAEFVYKAKRSPSEIVEGLIDADDAEAAVARLLKMGLSPVDVHVKDGGGAAAFSGRRRLRGRFRKASRADVSMFLQQFSDLNGSSLPVLQSLEFMERQTQHPFLRETVRLMAADVRDGASLSEAMARHPRVFSNVVVHVVRSGEMSGKLTAVLGYLSDVLEQEQEMRSRVSASLVYPALIFCVGVVTVFVLLTWVIPRIVGIFEDLGEALPLMTRMLIGVSLFFQKFWWMIGLITALIGLGGYRKFSTPEGRLQFDSILLKVPLFGNMLRCSVLARFARTLGMLIQSGVDIVSSLETVQDVSGSEALKRDLVQAAARVRDGERLTAALAVSPFFSEMSLSLISIGETSGELGSGLLKLARFYERQTQRAVKLITSLIEPVLILVLGIFVGFIVLAMLMPIFRMNLMVQ
ncbi:MAG TPA: type II secretion system F family protein [Candidatus Omnitrophota bacterium]|nr:type II secretion system F family protein [Candidatus Omnitrophota bacterium]HSA30604.1 type II secretion system F family protein [Candidatus Omnitrophota bacterium]